MKDTWNPAELNPEIAKVDSWNTAQLNNFVKRKDTWNPAELSEYINRKYNLEAEIDANIDDNTASFTVIEPDVIKEIKYTIDQEEGSASQLILLNDVMPAVKNEDVFNLRQFPTDSTGYSYEANPELIGGSVVWNQLVKNGNFADTSIWSTQRVTLSVSGNVGSVTLTDTTDPYIDQRFNSQVNHKYLYTAQVKRANSNTNVRAIAYYNGTGNSATYTTNSDNWEDVAIIVDNTVAGENRIRFTEVGTKAVGDTFQVRNVNVFDLTAKVQVPIANYIYTLEQGTAGSGVAWFRKYFPEVYYAYSAPTIQSTKVSSKVVKDANDQTVATYDLSGSHLVKRKYAVVEFDGSEDEAWVNYSVTQGNLFRISTERRKSGELSSIGAIVEKYVVVASGNRANMTVSGATTYFDFINNDIADITAWKTYLSNNPIKAVYELATPTTETVTNPTLYGIWKLDANNNLYFDGDSIADIPNPMVVEAGGTEEYIDAAVEDEDRDVSLPVQQNIYWIKDCRTVTVPDPPETLTDAEVTIDKTGAVTIIDNSGEEPATYTTSITPMNTLLGENYLTVQPGELTELKYTRIKPKPLAKAKRKTTKSKKED